MEAVEFSPNGQWFSFSEICDIIILYKPYKNDSSLEVWQILKCFNIGVQEISDELQKCWDRTSKLNIYMFNLIYETMGQYEYYNSKNYKWHINIYRNVCKELGIFMSYISIASNS